MKEIETIGKTVEEAVNAGLRALNASRDEVDIRVISEGGWLKKARVVLSLNESDEVIKPTKNSNTDSESNLISNIPKSPEATAENASEVTQEFTHPADAETFKNQDEAMQDKPQNQPDISHAVERVEKFLSGLLQVIGESDAKISVQENPTQVIFTIDSKQNSVLIGRQGASLSAIKTLASNLYYANVEGKCKKLQIDVGNYMADKAERLKVKAERAVERCVKTGRPVVLEPMNAYDRRIVHDTVSQKSGICSESFGKEPHRRVKITVKD